MWHMLCHTHTCVQLKASFRGLLGHNGYGFLWLDLDHGGTPANFHLRFRLNFSGLLHSGIWRDCLILRINGASSIFR